MSKLHDELVGQLIDLISEAKARWTAGVRATETLIEQHRKLPTTSYMAEHIAAQFRQEREAQAAEIKQLREALSDILTRFEPWSPDDYIADKAARAALGEAK